MKKILDFIKKNRSYFVLLGIVICLVAVDQITKYVVKTNVQYGLTPGIEVIRNFFYITYSENTGALNGSFTGKSTLLIIVTLVAIGVFIYLVKDINFTKKKLYSWALTLIIAGTFGNFIDRLFNDGGVVDFLSFYPIGAGHDWGINWLSLNPFPTFNIADSCLTVGVIALAIDILFFEKDLFKKKDDKPNVPADELKEEQIEESTNGNN